MKIRKEENKPDYREHRAVCGIITDPCNLNITIQTGSYNLLPQLISKLEGLIKESKDVIIDTKNQLLFGYITSESALESFDFEKEAVEDFTALLEDYLNEYLKITENVERKTELDESLAQSYELIENIKQSILLYDETENKQYVKDAVTIYITTLQPLLKQIMSLKYKQNLVYYDPDDNCFHLIQNKNTIKSLEYTSFVDKVINYDVGYASTAKQPMPISTTIPKKRVIIDSSSDSEDSKFKLKPSIIQSIA